MSERKIKLQIKDMTKKYDNGDGVEHINLDIYEGEIVTFLGSMEEAQGTMLVGMAKVQTMPVAMYGIVLDSSAVQIGAVFAILLIIPSALMIFAMRKYIGPEAISGGFKMK